MTQWEYCAMDRDGRKLIIYKATGSSIINHIKANPDKGDTTDEHAWNRVIAELGMEGWEMVDASYREGYGSILYFRRMLG